MFSLYIDARLQPYYNLYQREEKEGDMGDLDRRIALKYSNKGEFAYRRGAAICSLATSGNKSDQRLAEKMSRDSEWICLTCKRTARDRERICSPAFK